MKKNQNSYFFKKHALFLKIGLILLSLSFTYPAFTTDGNTTNDSFQKAKKILENHIYFDHRETFYCHAPFNVSKMVELPTGFQVNRFKSRSRRVEWEHVVPAENFGRTFVEWRTGHPDCIDRKGNSFKGRKCAEKINREYRFMQSDMYNLYPAIGSVNALRLNYNFTQFQKDEKPSFGSCPMKIKDKKVEPPQYTRGAIARTYLYFQDTYPRYKMSPSQKKLMEVWNSSYPVDAWECKRSYRIEQIQKNENKQVKEPCISKGLWPKED